MLALPSPTLASRATASDGDRRRRVVIATKSFTGPPGPADRWGYVEVTLVVRKTTTTSIVEDETVTRKITGVTVPVYPDHTDRSVFISQQAIPMLIRRC